MVDLFIVLYATDDPAASSTSKDSPGFLSLCGSWHYVIQYLIVTGAALFISDFRLSASVFLETHPVRFVPR